MIIRTVIFKTYMESKLFNTFVSLYATIVTLLTEINFFIINYLGLDEQEAH